MQSKVLSIFTIALICAIACIEAYPQFSNIKPRQPRPPPTTRPRPMRVRRDLGGKLSSNPSGGADAQLHLSEGVGTPNHNLIGTAFASGNTDHGPVTTGGRLAYNNNGFGAAITKEHTPGVRDTLTQSASANLFNNGVHSVDANVFKSQNTLPSGFKFERNGGSIDYSHINGHGLSLGQSSIPDFGRQLQASGTANLWTSMDKNTKLDLTGSASKWMSGPFSGRTDYGGNLGLTHMFG